MRRLREENLSLNGEIQEEVDSFKYLGALIGKKGGVEEDMMVRVNDGTECREPWIGYGRFGL